MTKNLTILHEVTPEQINTLFEGLQKEIKELKTNFEPIKPTDILTVNEVAEMLKVDRSTLWNWQQKGTLVPYGIGARVYYRRSDIEASLILLGKKKGANDEK